MQGEYIASIIGLIATTQIHISKGLQRFGIEGFSGKSSLAPSAKSSRKRLYIFALLLNNSAFLWVMIANLHAAPAAYTSMFGFGLIVLMLYSERVLKEKVGRVRHTGALLLAAGTFLLGWAGARSGRGGAGGAVMAEIDLRTVLWTTAGFFAVMTAVLTAAKIRKASPAILGALTGTMTGVAGASDPLFKAIAQHHGGGSGLLPSGPGGWTLFIFSFLFGTIALALTQAGFAWKARATVIVPAHNIALILYPLILLPAALPGYSLTLLHLPGIALVCSGTALLFHFGGRKAPPHP